MNELRLTVGWVAQVIGGHLHGGDAGRAIGEVVTDTRALGAGDLFVALRGPTFDGHNFVANAFDRGAVGAIVESGYAGSGQQDPAYGGTDLSGRRAGPVTGRRAGPAVGTRQDGLIEVGNTLKALQDLAHAVRATARTRVVAITGSAGKTTTKDAIAEFLSTRVRVVKNQGNLNNHIGLPLSLMQLRTLPDVAVMELGMNHAGEISTLVAIAAPDVRVWTNVGDAHLGFFASPDAIADAKAEILELASSATVLVANADDPRVMMRTRGFVGRTLTFGTSDRSTVRAHQIEDLGIEGTRALLTTPVGERRLETPLLGRGNLSNVLAATTVALNEGIPLDDIVAAAARIRPGERRGAVRRLRDSITVIDDSYNSSPSALRQALEVVARTPSERRVAVLGEMLELGGYADALHRDCGRVAAESGISLLIATGGAPARLLADAARSAGMSDSAVLYAGSSDEAASLAASMVRPGDLVLVKGSRGTRTDRVVDRLVAEHG